jgi:Uma2 family endonuclease
MQRPRVRATREDYERLPEHVKAELIDGEIVVTPAPSDWHERLVAKLNHRLCHHLGEEADERLRGSRTEVSAWEMGEEKILQPDAVVFPEGTRPTGKDWKAPIPVWVAEVLSPSTAKRDRGVKIRLYAAAGVREAWLVDPDAETIEVFDLATKLPRVFAKGESAVSKAIPGFSVDVAGLFAV